MSFLNYATRHQPWAIRKKSLFAKMRRYVSCTHTMAACNTRCCEKVSSQNASAWATTACTTEASNAISNFTVRARARSEVRLFGFSALLKFEIAGPGAQDWWDQSGRKRPPAQAPVALPESHFHSGCANVPAQAPVLFAYGRNAWTRGGKT